MVLFLIVDRIAMELSKNWESITDFECTVDKFESNPEFVQIVPSSAPVVVVSMEVKIHGNSTLINICYPHTWISSIVSTPEVQGKILFGSREYNEEERNIVKQNLKNTNVNLRAILGKSEITVNDFVNLRKGDVIKLDSRIDSQLPLYIENRQLSYATIGVRAKICLSLDQRYWRGER